MAELFISYARADVAFAKSLQTYLTAHGLSAVFLDVDPATGLQPGADWLANLIAELRRVSTVIWVCSATSRVSPFCFAELIYALGRGCHVFPVRIEECELPSVISTIQAVDAWHDPQLAFARLLERLEAIGVAQQARFVWDEARAPYPGFNAFESEDRGVFFGRTAEIEALTQLVTRLGRAAHGMAQVVGSSGSGKSSLVRAGLMCDLMRLPKEWIVLAPVTAGPSALDDLAQALVMAFVDQRNRPSFVDARDALAQAAGGSFAALSALCYELRIDRSTPQARVFWFIDQAERLLESDRTTMEVRELIRSVAETPCLVTVCTAVRADQHDELDAALAIDARCVEAYYLRPLARERLTEIVEGPARVAGLTLGDGVTVQLVMDAGGLQGLPVLAFALRELWDRFGKDRREVTLDNYLNGLGGMQGCVGRKIDAALAEMQLAPKTQSLLVQTLGRMARLAAASAPHATPTFVTKPLSFEQIPDELHDAVTQLVDAHLLTRNERRFVEPVHEILFEAWGALAEVLLDDIEFLRFQAELAATIAQWQVRANNFDDVHLSGELLQRAQSWLSAKHDTLTDLEREFISGSIERGTRIEALTLAGDLAAQAQLVVLTEAPRLTDRGLLLAIEAAHRYASYGRQSLDADQALRRALAILGRPVGARTSTANVTALYVSSNTAAVVHGSRDGAVHLWSLTDDAADDSWQLDAAIEAVALSANGRWLCFGDSHGNCRLVDRKDGGVTLLANSDSASVHTICFDADDTVVAVAGFDINVWSLGDPASPITLVDGESSMPVVAMAFGANAANLVTQRAMSDTVVWDWRKQEVLRRFNSSGNDVQYGGNGRYLAMCASTFEAQLFDLFDGELHSLANNAAKLAFNHDGSLLAMASPEHFVRVFSLPERVPLHMLRHNTEVWGVAFSPDGNNLISRGKDDVAYVWDLAAERTVALLLHQAPLREAAFLSDSRHALTWSGDGTLTLWDTQELREYRVLRHQVAVLDVAFAPQPHLIATNARVGQFERSAALVDFAQQQPVTTIDDVTGQTLSGSEYANRLLAARRIPAGEAVHNLAGTLMARVAGPVVRVLDATSGALVSELAHNSNVRRVVFSPDGDYLATCVDHDNPRIWDARAGVEVARLTHPNPNVTDVDFSSDGRFVATSSWDHTVRMWYWRLPDLIQCATQRLCRMLTQDEWEQYFPVGTQFAPAVCTSSHGADESEDTR